MFEIRHSRLHVYLASSPEGAEHAFVAITHPDGEISTVVLTIHPGGTLAVFVDASESHPATVIADNEVVAQLAADR